MMRSAGKVGLAVMGSRILGLVRDQIFAFCFGAGFLMDCYMMAFRIPNLLRDLFAEGALSTAFVTVFARRRAQEGDEGAWRLARLVMTLQVALLAVIVLLGILFTPQIVRIIAPGFTQVDGKFELTVTLTRVLFPFILFVAMAALTMGVLNTFGRFGLPASATIFFNVVMLAVGLSLAKWLDPSFGATAIQCMAVGALVGGVVQWLVQVPALRAFGYRYRFSWNLGDPGLHAVLKLMVPTLIGVSAVQVNVVINSIFASGLENGSVSWLAYAFRLIQLPIGLFGVAISTAALPSLAVDATLDSKQTFRDRLEHAFRLNVALCLPAACGLAIVSRPLVAVLFERGKFGLHDTEATAAVVMAYSVGLVGYASIKVLVAGFYALNRTMVPMAVSLGSIGLTFVLNWFFVSRLRVGAAGVAFATSISALGSMAILQVVLARMVGGISRDGWRALQRVAIACVVMSAAVLAVLWLHDWLAISLRWWGNLSRVILGVSAGLAAYGFAARKLHLAEALAIEDAVRARLGLRPRPPSRSSPGSRE